MRDRAVIQAHALTKRYALLRRTELKSRQKRLAPEPEEQTQLTISREEMQAWMTELRDVPVLDPDGRLATQKRLRLEVDSAVDRRYVMLMFPSTVSASAERPLEL